MRIILALLIFLSSNVFARDYIRIVGSSTVYPFITVVAEKFGKISRRTPIVEATGTGGGFNIVCSGDNSLKYPDAIVASRSIRPSEAALCKKHNIRLKEIKLGYDGIIIAHSLKNSLRNLTEQQLYLAIAKKVPLNGEMVDNFYYNWKQIDPKFPDDKIEIYGPATTSGTRDVLTEFVLERFDQRDIREDGFYIAMPEDYNLVIQKLIRNKKALGVISYSFLKENPKIRPLAINGFLPTQDNIIDNQYPFARPLFIYINMKHSKKLPSINKFIAEIERAKKSYLEEVGLIN